MKPGTSPREQISFLVSWIPDLVLGKIDMEKPTNNEELAPITAKISAALAQKPEIFITHPAELRLLRSLSEDELRKFATEHGWRAVRRLGGRQIEFYNDATVRSEV